MSKKKPYLADVQVGDRLYNFLEGNKEYKVVDIYEPYGETCIELQSVQDKDDRLLITYNGTTGVHIQVPFLLYQPVKVLDPENLPSRLWRPKKGEHIWVKNVHDRYWNLRPFIRMTKVGRYECRTASGNSQTTWDEAAPFRGELPPGLEGEE